MWERELFLSGAVTSSLYARSLFVLMVDLYMIHLTVDVALPASYRMSTACTSLHSYGGGASFESAPRILNCLLNLPCMYASGLCLDEARRLRRNTSTLPVFTRVACVCLCAYVSRYPLLSVKRFSQSKVLTSCVCLFGVVALILRLRR